MSLDDKPDAKADVFIDDTVTVVVDILGNIERVEAAPCTVIHAIAHNVKGKVHILRQDIISDEKKSS